MKENFGKAVNFVKEHDVAFALGVVVLSSATFGYILGKSAGGLTWKQIETLMATGGRITVDYAKEYGLEAAEKIIKLG